MLTPAKPPKQKLMVSRSKQDDAQRELENLQMQLEDTRSRQYEELMHRQLFRQKDCALPVIPLEILPRPGMPLEYRPLQPTPKVQEPQQDNYTRFQISARLPPKIDLASVKVKYSKVMETQQLEERRREEARIKRENLRNSFQDLVMAGVSESKKQVFNPVKTS